jgi:hypothetical protein
MMIPVEKIMQIFSLKGRELVQPVLTVVKRQPFS